MMKTEKAPASAATLTGAVENGLSSQTAHASTHDSIIPTAGRQPLRIADFLHPGAENAISRRDLMALTGYKDRELRAPISKTALNKSLARPYWNTAFSKRWVKVSSHTSR